MRFHSIAVICALAAPTVDAFGVPRQQVSFARPATSALSAKNDYDFLEDTYPTAEKKAYVAPKKKGKIGDAKPAPAPAPAPVPVPEPEPVKPTKVKKEKKVKKAEPVVEAPKIPEPEPVKDEPKLKKTKNKAEKAKTAPAPSPAPAPAPVARKVEPKAVAKDANAVSVGVIAGGAPLLLAPIVALAAGRSTLMATKARRDTIVQKEIEKAVAKKKVSTDIDGASLGKAVVSINFSEMILEEI